MSVAPPKKRVLIFIPAYHAESTIASVIQRIPTRLQDSYDVDVLVIDDASRDETFARGHEAVHLTGTPYKVDVLYNPVNQGYGGNQKIGYRYAIENDYDLVAMIHGDGQYAPEALPELLAAFAANDVGAVFGSRMLTPRGALKGGMPLYKYAGNHVLTWVQNQLLGTALSEFHSGYRIYSVRALKSIPFERNTNDFHFDTEIIIQLLTARLDIVELPIPTFYGDEICRVNGLRYALDVVLTTAKSRLQRLGILYDRRFDCAPPSPPDPRAKLLYPTPQSVALKTIPPASTVLDLAAVRTGVAEELWARKGCSVTGVDSIPAGNIGAAGCQDICEEFYCLDLDEGLAGIPVPRHNFIIFLDRIEHLASPEQFLDRLYDSLERNPRAQLLISTANVGFIIPRLMHLFGHFNYSKRGILDLTHTRLFTFSSFRRCLEQAGFSIDEMQGIPAPFPLAFGENRFSRLLLAINSFLIRLLPGLFAYQIFVRAQPRPTVAFLLNAAVEASAKRRRSLEYVN